MPLLWKPPTIRPAFDAVILAEAPRADARVLGLSLGERASRVARRLGARRITVVATPEDARGLDHWFRAGGAGAVLVVWASDQVVHMPLCEPLLDAAAARALAVTPEGAFAGAALAADPAAIAELLAAPDDAARAWMQRADVVRAEHGAIARHAAGTALERRAAGRYLEQIIHKSQDGPVTRWLYRPVSLPLTRLLLRTPVTPNQVSVLVALLGGLGIWFVAHASYEAVVIGSAIVVVAAYLDGCDGEIARLKLQVSRVGAWLDTIIDELTTVAYMVALGWHNYLRHPEPWVGWSIGFGLATYLLAIYFIYYYLIVVHGSANSQDYVDRLEIVDGRALRPVVSEAPSGLWAVLPHLARRDFINWGALAFAAMHWTDIAYALMLTGGAVTVVKIGLDHLALRRQLRTLRAAG